MYDRIQCRSSFILLCTRYFFYRVQELCVDFILFCVQTRDIIYIIVRRCVYLLIIAQIRKYNDNFIKLIRKVSFTEIFANKKIIEKIIITKIYLCLVIMRKYIDIFQRNVYHLVSKMNTTMLLNFCLRAYKLLFDFLLLF